MRQLVVIMSIAVASTFVVSNRAEACRACDQFLNCVEQSIGAHYCFQQPNVCTMLGQCFIGGRRAPDGSEGFTTWTLFDAASGPSLKAAPAPEVAVRSEAGVIALGEEARASAGAGAPTGALVDEQLGFGDDFAISLVSAAGDGFALKRAAEGGRVRVEVREVAHELPGRVLANEALGPRDQLRVPVTVEGRTRVLLLHATRFTGPGAAFELPRLRRSLEQATHVLPPRAVPLLKVRAQ